MNFDIRLTDKELDYVANILAQRPWAEVNALLNNIRQQIDLQQQAMAAVPGLLKSNGLDPEHTPATPS